MKKLLILFLFLPIITNAQDAEVFKPDSIKKELNAVEIDTPLQIDGILDEADWGKAKPSPRFTQINPYQGEDPNFDTEIKVLYDETYLYLGVICLDSLGKKAIRATDFKRDFNFRTHDLITMGFDGFNDERNAMSFAVNPYGVQRDYLSFDAMYYDIEWDGLWRTRTTRTDSGWIAEIAIPWKTLRYPEVDGEVQNWGFQLYRNRRLTNEITAFSPFPRSFSAARMDYSGQLKNLKPPPPKANIQTQPYFLTSYNHYEGPNKERKSEETQYSAGGELKWAINPNDVLDITVNTDFAQADVDRQVNNTSRFSVFFPERRQFFLENASLFGINVGPGGGLQGGSMRIQPFFSRRIGLDNGGQPIPIDVGGRFVHRSSDKNYGVILMRQRGDSLTPATNFFVGRFSENFGKQNRVGGLMTLKNSVEGSNITANADAFIRLAESHSINTLLSYSGTTATGEEGFSGIAQYYYSTNKWKGWWTQSIVSKNFNPEMGFISRKDVIGTTPGIIRYIRGENMPFKKWIRAFEPGLMTQFYHQASTGKLIEKQISLFPFYLNLQSGGYIGYGFSSISQYLTEDFSPLGVTIGEGDYDYLQQTVLASTDPSKKFSATGIITWGSYFNGDFSSGDLQMFFSPIPHFSLVGRFNQIHFKNVGINNTTKTVDLYSIEGRFALNPRLQLSSFYQRNSDDDSENINIRFSWEYKPLSSIYIVYNHREYDFELLYREVEDQAIGKIGYLKQF